MEWDRIGYDMIRDATIWHGMERSKNPESRAGLAWHGTEMEMEWNDRIHGHATYLTLPYLAYLDKPLRFRMRKIFTFMAFRLSLSFTFSI